MSGRRRSLWKKLLLFTVVLVCGLCVVEVAVRIFLPTIEFVAMSEMLPDDRLGYRLRPGYDNRRDGGRGRGHVQVSSQGYRDDEFAAKQKGEFRVLLLGDSFSYGHAVEKDQVFGEVLEQSLQQDRPQQRVSVLNTGVPSWATFQQARLLEEVGPRFEPDLVVLQFCFNDLEGNLAHQESGVQFLAQSVRKMSMGGGVKRALAKYSHAVRLFVTWSEKRKSQKLAADQARERADRYTAKGDGLSPQEYLRALCIEFVEDIRTRCAQWNAPLAIFIVRQAGGKRGEIPPEPASEDHFLYQFAESNDIPVLTFTQAVERAGVPFAECSDTHFTLKGHEVAGQQIFALLKRRGLL